jgi:hypothetical protein
MYRFMLFLRGPYGSHLGGAQFLWFAFLFGLIWFGDKWADKPGGLPWFFFWEETELSITQRCWIVSNYWDQNWSSFGLLELPRTANSYATVLQDRGHCWTKKELNFKTNRCCKVIVSLEQLTGGIWKNIFQMFGKKTKVLLRYMLIIKSGLCLKMTSW